MQKVFDNPELSLLLERTYLSEISNIKIGGKAKYLFAPQSIIDITKIYQEFKADQTPVLVVGGATNILFADNCEQVLITDKDLPKELSINDNLVTVSANTQVATLIDCCAAHGLKALIYMMGVPAHIGGIIKMNAGAYDESAFDNLKWLEYANADGVQKVYKNEIKHGYRHVDINGFITRVCFEFPAIPEVEIRVQIAQNLNLRRIKQPLEYPNLGCFFSNPANTGAGRLIDGCGLKGYRIGGASISTKHANFIINDAAANYADIVALIKFVKTAVLKKYNIELNMEVIIAK